MCGQMWHMPYLPTHYTLCELPSWLSYERGESPSTHFSFSLSRKLVCTSSVYGQINVYSVTTKSERYERSYWTRTAAGNGIGGRKAPVPYGS